MEVCNCITSVAYLCEHRVEVVRWVVVGTLRQVRLHLFSHLVLVQVPAVVIVDGRPRRGVWGAYRGHQRPLRHTVTVGSGAPTEGTPETTQSHGDSGVWGAYRGDTRDNSDTQWQWGLAPSGAPTEDSMHGLAAMKMSLHQYFRLLLDYRDIGYIPTNEPWHTLWCQLIVLSSLYYQVDKSSELSGWWLVTMNAVYLWRYFPDEKYAFVDYKRYHLIKLIKTEWLNWLHPFNRLNTSWKLIYTLYVNQAECVLSGYI